MGARDLREPGVPAGEIADDQGNLDGLPVDAALALESVGAGYSPWSEVKITTEFSRIPGGMLPRNWPIWRSTSRMVWL